MKRLIAITITLTLLFGCTTKVKDNEYNVVLEHLVFATIWFQSSPEVKALYHQGFNIAKERVMEYKKQKTDKPKAVVVDLDETMIDNSPFQGKMIEKGKGFSPEFWGEWVALEQAKALPGAVEFTQFCQTVGVDVIYLSNRTVAEQDATMSNMEKLGFAFVKPENFFLKETTSGKEPRREKISETFDIILLLGDNLNDFSDVFENRGEDWGNAVVEEYREEFGRRFVVFPNPLYGEWEKNVYKQHRNSDEKARFKMRREAVESY
jgi:5'-nucleotidase (lipoprotein e(P4) family)